MYHFVTSLMERFPEVRRLAYRTFYQFLASIDRDGDVTLMNYGYIPAKGDAPILLSAGDEPDRLCLQLYHHIASAVEMKDRAVLEVGSGRGGGAAYVSRTFKPRSLTGLDFSERAVAFCQRRHQQPGLEYIHGDAENLPFEEGRFDVAINVESSHGYGRMPRFLAEVYRVLRPGGRLSWTDFRPPREVEALEQAMRGCGFEIEQAAVITPNVLAAMDSQSERYRALVDHKAPRFARPLFYQFAGVEGSRVLDMLRSGELVYLHRVLVKVGR
jgi:ubiquinone/menaquinone biosynthesis C-methylase UbiE